MIQYSKNLNLAAIDVINCLGSTYNAIVFISRFKETYNS